MRVSGRLLSEVLKVKGLFLSESGGTRVPRDLNEFVGKSWPGRVDQSWSTMRGTILDSTRSIQSPLQNDMIY